jgi:hypothetical protein
MAHLKQDYKEAYGLLNPLKGQISLDSKKILLKASFEEKDYPLTIEMATYIFQEEPGPLEAFLAAKAGAIIGETELAIQFLKVALDLGLDRSSIQDPTFDKIRSSSLFQSVILEK